MSKPSYSLLSYNINNYEILKECDYKSPNAEYCYVTDNTGLTSSTWDMKYYDKPFQDPFLACYDIRFHPFDYVNTDIVMRIDGSMKCIGNTDEIIDVFNKGDYDICFCIHPKRNTLIDEYLCWVKYRGYPVEQANKILSYMNNSEGYDVANYKGLYQGNFVIQRNNKVNKMLNDDVFQFLLDFKPAGKQIERLDQTATSYIFNRFYYNKMKVMCVDNRIAYSKFFEWYMHNSDYKFERTDADIEIEPYFLNKPVDTDSIFY